MTTRLRNALLKSSLLVGSRVFLEMIAMAIVWTSGDDLSDALLNGAIAVLLDRPIQESVVSNVVACDVALICAAVEIAR